MAGDCGSCTMCCKLMGIKEILKPKNTSCPNCVNSGCAIYETRPASCASFRCIWLQTQALPAGDPRKMPEEMRPDKCKVVFTVTPDEKGVNVKVDPGFPLAWQEGKAAPVIVYMSNLLPVLVDVGSKYWMVRNSNAREVWMMAPDENGVEAFGGYLDEQV